MRAKSAFTLIELLIVVAIIAILAAIAVPNFIEAQTRAKISRARADMRSIATAIESYAVDHNRYPFAFNTTGGYFMTFMERLVPLTTPIAFMTTIPQDPYPNSASGLNVDEVFDYVDKATTETILPAVWGPFPAPESGYNKQWRLQSLGPDLVESLTTSPTPVEYDPTNGSTSFGDIHRYGP
jgi:prepilin-type N-terminal cleavage/methylation domain-containing protein